MQQCFAVAVRSGQLREDTVPGGLVDGVAAANDPKEKVASRGGAFAQPPSADDVHLIDKSGSFDDVFESTCEKADELDMRRAQQLAQDQPQFRLQSTSKWVEAGYCKVRSGPARFLWRFSWFCGDSVSRLLHPL
jgi:hypothetical protein